MSWTAPATATVGQVLTAAFLNTNLRDNMLWLGTRKWCHLRRTTTQLLTSGSVIGPFVFDAEIVDSDNFFPGPGGTTLTVPTGLGGIYAVSIGGTTATTFSDIGAFCRFTHTGHPVGFGNGSSDVSIAGSSGDIECSLIVPLVVGSTLTMSLFQNSGSNITLNTIALLLMWLGN